MCAYYMYPHVFVLIFLQQRVLCTYPLSWLEQPPKPLVPGSWIGGILHVPQRVLLQYRFGTKAQQPCMILFKGLNSYV